MLHGGTSPITNELLKLGLQTGFTGNNISTEPGILRIKRAPQSLSLLTLFTGSLSYALDGIADVMIEAKLLIAHAREVNRLPSNVSELPIERNSHSLCSNRRQTYLW